MAADRQSLLDEESCEIEGMIVVSEIVFDVVSGREELVVVVVVVDRPIASVEDIVLEIYRVAVVLVNAIVLYHPFEPRERHLFVDIVFVSCFSGGLETDHAGS